MGSKLGLVKQQLLVSTGSSLQLYIASYHAVTINPRMDDIVAAWTQQNSLTRINVEKWKRVRNR
jgi:hypothetical protein